MHTAANDPNGQDLYAIINDLGLQNREVLISGEKIPPDALVNIYNAADCTINISDAEGFGLATFESMACGTPIMTTMTGGLQEQVTSIKNITQKKMLSRNKRNKGVTEYKHGIGLEPTSKAIIGSQEVPFIYEDRVSEERVTNGLMMMYEFGASKRKEMGECARQHVLENYNFDNFASQWEKIILDTYEKHGSWETRKNYKAWELIAV
jgi:glycosyltransferase involved in cell wall biosynthesis